jgi:hypothetical protein
VLNVPFLFAGEVYLLAKRRSVAHGLLALLLVGSAFAAYRILTAPLNEPSLDRSLPLGKEVFGDNSLPAVLLVHRLLLAAGRSDVVGVVHGTPS